MVVILKPHTPQTEVDLLTQYLLAQGVEVSPVIGSELSILGLIGNTAGIDRSHLEANPYVDRVVKISEPFKRVNRQFHPDDSVVAVGGASIGGNTLALIAGPCSVETEEQITQVAHDVKQCGAQFLRGGAFKPRSSPYAFQGLKYQGLELLKLARAQTGLPIVTEIMAPHDIEVFERDVDVIQVGARNMQNFDLLHELGCIRKPILLKRGLSATVEEWLMAAEYIAAGGNDQIILCERGIRTFETSTRNTLDLSAVVVAKKASHLPVIVDPSHATGKSALVEPLALAAVAAGADGLIVEVHNDPAHAWCDGQQSITPQEFGHLMQRLAPVAQAIGRSMPTAAEH